MGSSDVQRRRLSVLFMESRSLAVTCKREEGERKAAVGRSPCPLRCGVGPEQECLNPLSPQLDGSDLLCLWLAPGTHGPGRALGLSSGHAPEPEPGDGYTFLSG